MSTANRSSNGTQRPTVNWERGDWVRPSIPFNGSTEAMDDPYQIVIQAKYRPNATGGRVEAFVEATAVREEIATRKLNDQLEGVTPQSNTAK